MPFSISIYCIIQLLSNFSRHYFDTFSQEIDTFQK